MPPPTSLLPLSTWDAVFTPLIGSRVWYAEGFGNVGDKLIKMGALALLAHHGIPEWSGSYDYILAAGGGNFGGQYTDEIRVRQTLLDTGKPVIVMPQSASGMLEYDKPLHKVYFREPTSAEFYEDPLFAPDLSLAVSYTPAAPEFEYGLFLRTDVEKTNVDLNHPDNEGDPALMVETAEQYLELASQYEAIVTNRLHFAIAGLICGRAVTLMPNSYHKNLSMFEESLEALGCTWSDTIP